MSTCSQCGTEQAEGLCPRCLLADALVDARPRKGIHPLWFVGTLGVLGLGMAVVAVTLVAVMEQTTVDIDVTRGPEVIDPAFKKQVQQRAANQRGRALVALSSARAEAARHQQDARDARSAAGTSRRDRARAVVAHDPMHWLDSDDRRGVPMIEPPICYAIADLGGSGDRARALRCADTALLSRGRWSGTEWIANVDSLYRLRAEVAHDMWESSGTPADRARARTYSSDWLDFALVAKQDISRPRELCVQAWKDRARCGG